MSVIAWSDEVYGKYKRRNCLWKQCANVVTTVQSVCDEKDEVAVIRKYNKNWKEWDEAAWSRVMPAERTCATLLPPDKTCATFLQLVQTCIWGLYFCLGHEVCISEAEEGLLWEMARNALLSKRNKVLIRGASLRSKVVQIHNFGTKSKAKRRRDPDLRCIIVTEHAKAQKNF